MVELVDSFFTESQTNNVKIQKKLSVLGNNKTGSNYSARQSSSLFNNEIGVVTFCKIRDVL